LRIKEQETRLTLQEHDDDDDDDNDDEQDYHYIRMHGQQNVRNSREVSLLRS